MKPFSQTILLCAGGTGGHLFPALRVAQVLKERGFSVVFLTDRRGKSYIPDQETSFVLPVSRLHWRSLTGSLKTLFQMTASVFYALGVILKVKPAVILGFGGYPSGPGLLGGLLLRCPFIIHEQNAYLGRVNRLFYRFARTVLLSFPQTEGIQKGNSSKVIVVGMPVAESFQKIGDDSYKAPSLEGVFRLLILGGSQGSSFLSSLLPCAVALLSPSQRSRLKIVHQCRKEDLESVRGVYNQAGIEAELSPFFSPVSEKMKEAHLIVSRAGGSSLGELMAARRPSFLIPFPAAQDNHQRLNGENLAAHGAAWMREENNLTPQTMAEKLNFLMTHPASLSDMADKARKIWLPQAEVLIADQVSFAIYPS